MKSGFSRLSFLASAFGMCLIIMSIGCGLTLPGLLLYYAPEAQHVTLSVGVQRFVRTRLSTQLPLKDYAQLEVTVKADLQSFWNWNVKQLFVYLTANYTTEQHQQNKVVVWDAILRTREESILDVSTRAKYYLEDFGIELGGKAVTFELHWSIMPIVGVSVDRHAPAHTAFILRLPEKPSNI